MIPKIIIHGGAWDIPKKLHAAHSRGITEALKVGQRILSKTDNSIETVLAIIKKLEDDPTFDAGKGSFLNNRAEVEMDAAIMFGDDLSVGAVAAIQKVQNPIEVANLVRTKTQHVLLVGNGATDFAKIQNIKIVDTEELLVGREKELYQSLSKQKRVNIKSFFQKKLPTDTVGTVVINSKGQIAVGTSTGGTPFKMAGRVGDCSIVGAGFYADSSIAGIACTGWGEGILRVQLARETCEFIKSGLNPQNAAASALELMHQKVDGNGGVIAITKSGEIGFGLNTPFMAVGAASIDNIDFVSLGRG